MVDFYSMGGYLKVYNNYTYDKNILYKNHRITEQLYSTVSFLLYFMTESRWIYSKK